MWDSSFGNNQTQIFAKLQRLPIPFFNETRKVTYLSRVVSDTGQLQAVILQVSNDLIKQPITFIGAISALIVMAYKEKEWHLFFLCLLVIPVCVFPIRRIGELLMSRALNMQEKAGDLNFSSK